MILSLAQFVTQIKIRGENDQLVKYKDTGIYLQLYILLTIKKEKDILEKKIRKV